jgi:hypothetical protein
MWDDGGEGGDGKEGRNLFLGWQALSLSLSPFGSLDLRGLEVPKSSKGRSKSSRGTAMRLRGERDAREGTAAPGRAQRREDGDGERDANAILPPR